MKKLTIMQFSDMHISSVFPSGKTFVTSILTDIARQKKELPPISEANILAICGDVVQGVDKDLSLGEASRQLRTQYRRALDVLDQLCEKLFEGDKDRVAIIPGNHDVSWSHSRKSMEKIQEKGSMRHLHQLMRTPESNYRWDWNDHSYYKVSDFEIYDRRFELFSEFYSNFYEGAREYSPRPEEQYDIFEYSEEKAVVACFNSCFRNDHLNSVGAINSDCITECYEKISQKKFDEWIKIAVWHHDIQGYPPRTDFMDTRVLQFLMDKGFHLGLHGHNHSSDIFEARFSIDENMKMNLFGCGSLGAPRDTIPLGEGRQYGLLELDRGDMTMRYHLRKALDQPPDLPIWTAGSIKQNRHKSYIDGELCVKIGKRATMTDVSKKLTEIEGLISYKEYARALEKLVMMDMNNPFVRRLTIECYWQLDKDRELIAAVGKPTSLIEFAYLTDALRREKDLPALRRLIEESGKDQRIASSELFATVKKRIEDDENG